MPTVILRPNSAGDRTELRNNPDTIPNWDCVDDETPDGDETYLDHADSTTTAAFSDLYNLPDGQVPAGSTINSVTIHMVVRQAYPDYGAFRTLIKTHETEYDGVPETPTTTYTEYTTTYTKNPYTNAPWTIDEINALQAGITLEGTWDGTVYIFGRATQIYVEVDYTLITTIVAEDGGVGADEVFFPQKTCVVEEVGSGEDEVTIKDITLQIEMEKLAKTITELTNILLPILLVWVLISLIRTIKPKKVNFSSGKIYLRKKQYNTP